MGRIVVPHDVDGSQGRSGRRARPALGANNDYAAAHAWLALHGSAATQRAYRKEAERLILWAIIRKARQGALVADHRGRRGIPAFLRHPARARDGWDRRGLDRPGGSPLAGGLSARSAAYALTVLGAMYRWLMQQRYVLANPFAGIRCAEQHGRRHWRPRAFSDGAEWNLIAPWPMAWVVLRMGS